ncbi:MAG: murein biosynthesis integral membrane protein MurJ [Anaerolineae bacterium]|nr:murein biosynthesis integral membrane protein MurJ [Anaerolineae bacterium]
MNKNHRQVARAAALVMVAFAISRLLGLLRLMIFSSYFGTGPQMDAYEAALGIPDALFMIVAGGALGSAFIPVFSGRLTTGHKEQAWHMASSIINIMLAVLVPASIVCIIFAPWLVQHLVAPELPIEVQLLSARLMRIMLISPTIFGISGIFMGILNAHQHFLLPAIAPILYNLGLIIGGIVGGTTSLGVMGPTIGVVAGAVAHLLVQLPGLLHYQARYTFTFGKGDPAVRDVGLLIAPRMLGMGATQINSIITNSLATRYGIGAISSLRFAWRLMLLPQGIFAQAVGYAVFPTFSAQHALGQLDELRGTLYMTLRMLVALTIPATAAFIVIGQPIVALMFERGLFDQVSTQYVTWALGFYALGLVGHSTLEVLGRAFFALQDTWSPAIAAIIALVINVVLGLTLPIMFTGLLWLPHSALALATAVAALVEAGLLLLWIQKRLGNQETGALWQTSWRVLLASGGMAIVLYGWMRIAPDNPWLQVLVALPLGLATYGGLGILAGVDEIMTTVRLLLRKSEG